MRLIDYILLAVIAILVILVLKYLRLHKSACRGCQGCEYRSQCDRHIKSQFACVSKSDEDTDK